ncbi:MAG TPA: hypothetical protein DC049_20235 [Spirochaetia bacterium]|nr:hypothetical protein [Spirochaetia bacterium]
MFVLCGIFSFLTSVTISVKDVQKKNYGKVEKLIAKKAVVPETVLPAAIALGDEKMVKLLIDGGADVNGGSKTDTLTMCNLSLAASSRNYNIVKLLVDAGANVNNTAGTDGITPLGDAAFYGNIDIIKLLVEKKADVNAQDTAIGNTILMDAIIMKTDSKKSKSEILAIVKILVAGKADLNLCGIDGSSPLLRAVEKGHAEIADILIENGADLEKKGSMGQTALMFAISHKQFDIAKVLINKGANANIKDEKGQTPLFFAVAMENTELVEALCQKGADMNTEHNFGTMKATIYSFVQIKTMFGGSETMQEIGKILNKYK